MKNNFGKNTREYTDINKKFLKNFFGEFELEKQYKKFYIKDSKLQNGLVLKYKH